MAVDWRSFSLEQSNTNTSPKVDNSGIAKPSQAEVAEFVKDVFILVCEDFSKFTGSEAACTKIYEAARQASQQSGNNAASRPGTNSYTNSYSGPEVMPMIGRNY
jgi:hypothetical protein